MVDFSKFFFVSNVCTGDYLNGFYKLGRTSPFDGTAQYDEQFIQCINNFDLDFTDKIYVPYQDVKVIKMGYHWNGFNSGHKIDSKKTFAFKYKLKNSNCRYELFYRHFEYNDKILEKIQRRIKRYKESKKQPFFIYQISPNMIKMTDKEWRIQQLYKFLEAKNDNKLYISPEKELCDLILCKKFVIYTQKLHEEEMPIIDEHLKIYF